MVHLAGVDIGQRHEPSGFCVVEESERSEVHYLVRHLERIPSGSGLPEIAQRVSDAIYGVHWRNGAFTQVFVDVTGFGQPVVELMQKTIDHGEIVPVYFNHGDRMTAEYPHVTLGKAYLVARLQMLLQTGRLHLTKTREARLLAEELQNYQIQVHPQANDHYGAFAVGTRDELVTALGMAVCGAMRSFAFQLQAY
jgi:hypothetical protein